MNDMIMPIMQLLCLFFIEKYLSTLRIDHPDILDVFNGMHYLPLERILYLKVQSFVNRLEANIPEIKHTIMLYNYQLIRLIFVSHLP